MDLISIIVPIYNAENYLKQCIGSILSQTYTDFELILVNDGSTDNSFEICNRYEKIDDRVHVITKTNSGVSDARNQGLEFASGEFICFVDADDRIKEDFVEVLYRELLCDDVDVVFCGFQYDYDGRLIDKKPRMPSGVYHTTDIKKVIIDDGTMSGILFGSACCAMYKKGIIEEHGLAFNKEIKLNEDGLFNIEYCAQANRVKVLSDQYLYIYRQNESSATKMPTVVNRAAVATAKIAEICKDQEIDMNLNQQLGARKVTEAFWMVLKLCSDKNPNNLNNTVKSLKILLSDVELRDSYQYINLREINKYKHVYYYLMKNKHYRALYVLNKHIYPILANKLSR